MPKIYETPKPRRFKMLPFKNSAMDFHQDMLLLRKTKSGNLIVGEVIGEGPRKLSYIKRRAVRQKDDGRYRFSEGGSAFNSYFYRP